MDKVKVSRAAASLVARGLLKQTHDPKDGRGRLLRLTRKGVTVHQGMVPLACELEEQLAEGMSRTEWGGLLKALDKLATYARASRARTATPWWTDRTADSPVTKTSLGSGRSSREGARMSGTQNGRSPRSVALVGPYSSGKSTLFEALMDAAGAPVKKPADPRNRPATTEVRLGHCSFLGDCLDDTGLPGLDRIRT